MCVFALIKSVDANALHVDIVEGIFSTNKQKKNRFLIGSGIQCGD